MCERLFSEDNRPQKAIMHPWIEAKPSSTARSGDIYMYGNEKFLKRSVAYSLPRNIYALPGENARGIE